MTNYCKIAMSPVIHKKLKVKAAEYGFTMGSMIDFALDSLDAPKEKNHDKNESDTTDDLLVSGAGKEPDSR